MGDNLLTDALKNCSKSMWQSQANVNINVGNGHSLMNLSGASVDVDTGCGNQNITAFSASTLDIKTGCCGKDTIDATSLGFASIFTYDSDDVVKLTTLGNFDVRAGVDATESTDDDFVTILKSYSTNNPTEDPTYGILNKAGLGVGDDKAVILADDVEVNKGAGTLLAGTLGSNYTFNTAATVNTVGGYGNNYVFNINGNRSDDDIRSLDYWLEDGVTTYKPDGSVDYQGLKITSDDGTQQYALKDIVQILDPEDASGETKMSLTEYDNKYNAETVKFFKDNLGALFNAATAYTAADGSGNFVSEVTTDPETVTTNNREALAEQYHLSDVEKQALMNLSDEELSRTFSDGKPMYAIVKSPHLTAANGGEEVYVLAVRNGTNVDGALHYASVTKYEPGGASECLKINASSKDIQATVAQSTTTTTTTTTTYENAHVIGNLSNWTVNAGAGNNGKTNFIASVANGEFKVTKGTDLTGAYTNKNIFNYIGGHILSSAVKVETKINPIETFTFFSILATNDSSNSPLVLDMNGDGVVSAKAGMGVDIDGDGKADGAATGGDKMLAMSDINGNGKIDGAEVFGNKTVSPFTGEALNAANGFEALEMIAKEAEKYTGIKCMNGSDVDLKELAKALETVGVSLGFISDNNVTELEELSGVKSINTDDYDEVNASGAVQHRQLGSFTDENGNVRKVDDVWFK